jgi:non-haem Fe2+, alpha-ketoglutarate-dependent halogenase
VRGDQSLNHCPFHTSTITVWTAFTDATPENGCLQLMPGTHRHMNYDESRAIKSPRGAFDGL